MVNEVSDRDCQSWVLREPRDAAGPRGEERGRIVGARAKRVLEREIDAVNASREGLALWGG